MEDRWTAHKLKRVVSVLGLDGNAIIVDCPTNLAYLSHIHRYVNQCGDVVCEAIPLHFIPGFMVNVWDWKDLIKNDGELILAMPEKGA